MRTELWKERWQEFKERLTHPAGRHEEEERRGKEREGHAREPEHKVDEIAGSE
jgi:hypothetical protein